jgi:hypothetical protein
MVSINDIADRPPRALADGEVLSLGRHAVQWFDTPHMPHGWDCGLMMETSTRTFLCGDLFTQGGTGATPLTESESSARARRFGAMDHFAHAPDTTEVPNGRRVNGRRRLRAAWERGAVMARSCSGAGAQPARAVRTARAARRAPLSRKRALPEREH